MPRSNLLACGVVSSLFRYPVKSMRGESLEQAHLYWHGLEGDRRYAFVRQGANSGFPWLTGRELAQLLRYTPHFVRPDDPRNSSIIVATPDGRELPLEAPELVEELAKVYRSPFFLFHLGRGAYDSQVLSLMSNASVAALGQSAGLDLESARFRQNIYIETHDGYPFQEDEWLDRVLVFGADPDGPRVRIIRRIVRCVMINIDPQTAERDARVLKTVAQTRDTCAGVYATVERTGTIRVGDSVSLLL
ncbi:MAG: MOSC domain-containing protein [Anaerolineae bacterium]|nr:MOSC domain-containing protein [Anaerolineae bacterium]